MRFDRNRFRERFAELVQLHWERFSRELTASRSS
jgi:hypothetical protein